MTSKIQYKKTQLGYFIDFSLWQDGLALLNFQIEQKGKNKHFNTLSMFYYSWLDLTCIQDSPEHYFNTKIASSLFYGLKREFCLVSYVIPKKGLGLRDYKFFAYPMRGLYYTVGLYLLKLSQNFLTETYEKIKTVTSFYGGSLIYKSEEIQLTRKNIYYRSFYEQFSKTVKREIEYCKQAKVVLRLDIENCFNEIDIPRLLEFIGSFVKPSVQVRMKYDVFTKEQIICLFKFISTDDRGIPQAENNIISSFIGHLYLTFGDMFVDDLLNSYRHALSSHKIIRYVDDVYISLTFREDVSKAEQSSCTHAISSQISELFYRKLNLKLNAKTKLYHLSNEKEKEEILKSIRKVSHNDGYFSYAEQISNKEKNKEKSSAELIQEKINDILTELVKIKESRIDDYFVGDSSAQRETLQQIFDDGVDNCLNKQENKSKIKQTFEAFDFDLVKVQPLEILIIIIKDEDTTACLRDFYLRKPAITIFDVDIIVKFLCQVGFTDKELIDKLSENSHMSDIVRLLNDKKISCDSPGYYNLFCMQIRNMSEMPDVLEQTRLRILNERRSAYSVALNHLVNEIHAVCIYLEKANKKTYNANDVVKCLKKRGVRHKTYVKVRNMFDRRNSNSVSHPGDETSAIWEVTKQEYIDYSKYVGECLDVLL